MQEDEDIETHYKGHRWEGEMSDFDSEEGEHKQEQQQLMKLHSPGLNFQLSLICVTALFSSPPLPHIIF